MNVFDCFGIRNLLTLEPKKGDWYKLNIECNNKNAPHKPYVCIYLVLESTWYLFLAPKGQSTPVFGPAASRKLSPAHALVLGSCYLIEDVLQPRTV